MLRNWQLALAAFWLLVAAAVYFREPLGLDSNRYSENHYWLFLAMSTMLAVWNVVRWSASRPRRVEAPPRKEPAAYEYNPDLDFQKMDREGT